MLDEELSYPRHVLPQDMPVTLPRMGNAKLAGRTVTVYGNDSLARFIDLSFPLSQSRRTRARSSAKL